MSECGSEEGVRKKENANILILGALVLTRPENFQLPTIILTINSAITPFTLHF
jgi:hypothetical protein